MKKKKSKILIIEKSDIIRAGLSSILLDKSKSLHTIELCEGDCDWQLILPKIRPNILIGSPAVFEKNKKHIRTIKQKYKLQIVALIYAYYHPDDLSNFDALLYLDDSPEKIYATLDKLANTIESPIITSSDSLSERETEVLKLLTSGFSTKQIADTLHISVHTVNNHRKNISRKLDIKTISGLTIYAVLHNIISLEEA